MITPTDEVNTLLVNNISITNTTVKIKDAQAFKLHQKAFLTNFELACEAAIIALVADVIWLLHDITYAGMSLWYAFVFVGLAGSLGLTIFTLIRHHKYYTSRLSKRNQIKKVKKSLERECS